MLTGVVLAGGRSRRMGQDKASLIWRGHTLLEHACTLLEGLGCGKVRVSGRPDHPLGHADRTSEDGPGRALADLLTMDAASASGLIVIPVDMPRLTPEDLMPLIAPGSARARIWSGHPLPAWFPTGTAPEALADARSIRDVLDAFNVEHVPLDSSRLDHFANINTAEDFASLDQSI